MIQIEEVGIVKSPVDQAVDDSWGDIESEIHLKENFVSGLKGIESFSHLLVIFYMHRSEFEPNVHLQRRPRDIESMPLLGIFAQRAKHRPNPIGITAVENLGVEGSVLKVKGLDAINGTPVLDIKPYVPDFDQVKNAVTPGWINQVMKGYFSETDE